MKRLFLIALTLSFFLFSFAEDLRYINKNNVLKTKVSYQKDKNNQFIIHLQVNAYQLNEVNTEKGKQFIVNIPDASQLFKKGAPDLSKLTSSFIIPDYNNMDYEIISSEYIEINDIDIAPSKGHILRTIDPNTIPYEYGKIYNQDEFFPKNLVKLNKPYILRYHRGQTIWFNPVQYNPVKKILRIYTDIQIKYFNSNKKGENELIHKNKHLSSVYNEIYKNHFINYNEEKYSTLSDEGKMLIISYDNFSTEMTDFIAWKKQRGLEIELVNYSEVGTSASDIQTFVSNYYTTNGLTFLLLVGDGEQIPSLSKSGDSDAAYGHIEGDDSYAEVIVGRFSAETVEQVRTQVARSIYYEKDITVDDSWLGKAIGIASNEGKGDGDDGETDIEHMDNIRQDLLDFGFTTVDQIYDPGAIDSQVADAVNEGRGLINYVGHGSDFSWATTGFNNSDVNNLTNENKLPIIFDVACVNGNFHNQTCFAESWLRQEYNDKPAGAVAMIASTINQSWASPMDGQDEMVDLFVHSYELL